MRRMSAIHAPSMERTPDAETVQGLMARVRAHYAEMPGLSLTLPQARRLLGLDDGLCTRVLTALRNQGFLRETRDGRFVTAD
jgi:hypothetical protein